VFAAPRDSLEGQLVELWQKVLGVPSIGVRDDFFELGGDSLKAIEIFLGIDKILERNFPVATLFEAPTVEQLASALRREDRRPKWSHLVPIQSRGSRAPFFAVHGDDGQIFFYRSLARILGSSQPFYGLQSQGLDGRPIRCESIGEMAADYIEEVRGLQPQGPYFLGGYCFGGVVAFEMAQQLQAAGEEIALLVLFDAPNPARPPRPYKFIERFKLCWHEASLIPRHARLRYFLRRGSDKIGASLSKGAEQIPRILSRPKHLAAEPLPGDLRALHIQMIHNHMMKSYRPRLYGGRITLLRAANPTGNYEFSSHLGWSNVAKEGVEIYSIPGSHETMFLEPHVQVVAEKLAFCIEAAFPKYVHAFDVTSASKP
jgi:thioesterase domain-containing protein